MESEWEVYSMKERWGEINGARMFLYTHVVYLRNKAEFWTARVPGRYPFPEALPAAAAAAAGSCGTWQQVDRTHLFPPLDPGAHLCDDDEPDKAAGIFVKRVRVDTYDGFSPTLARYVAHEARICQRLRSYPHPNLARFRGCDVAGGSSGSGGEEEEKKILGLCFDRYAETLTERMRRGAVVDTENCMAQIRAAVRHLHGLQLVHNDVVPDNVMFVDDGGPGLVLIDFDSCATRGGGLPAKRGPVTPGATRSEFENDYLGLQLIHRALLRYEHDTRS